MRKIKLNKNLNIIAVSVLLASVLSACSASDSGSAPIVAKFSHAMSASTPYQRGALKFKELVEERTNGQIKIEVYPNSQLGADREILESLQLGTVEFAANSSGLLKQAFGIDSDVFCLPFLAESPEEYFKLVDSEMAKEVFAPTKENGVEIITSFTAGFRQLSNNKRPINTLEDCTGLKIRTPEADIYLESMRALGIDPVPMAYSETFTAMQTGVVDGQDLPIANFAESGSAEVQKYFAIINYMNDPIVIAASSRFMDKLTVEQQEIVRQAAVEAAEFERNYVLENEQALLQRCIDDWGLEVTYPDIEPFRDAVQSVWANYPNQEILVRVKEQMNIQ